MPRPAPLLFLALLLLPAASPALAEADGTNRLDAIIARGVLRVGTTGDYRPFTYFDPEANAFEGIDMDMARSLAHALGVRLELVRTSWPTLSQDLLADKFDLAMGGISATLARLSHRDRRYVAQRWCAVRSEGAGDAGHRQARATRQRANTVQPGGTASFVARGRRAALPMSLHRCAPLAQAELALTASGEALLRREPRSYPGGKGRRRSAYPREKSGLERQKTALFSNPYLTDGKTPIARCADEGKYRSLAEIDRPGVRVIVNPGGTNERFAREHLKAAAIETYPDNTTIFDQIAQGKADVIITDRSEVLLQHKLRPGLCATNADHPFDTVEKAYLLPHDLVLKAFVDQWLHQALITGDYQKIADHWLHEPTPFRREE